MNTVLLYRNKDVLQNNKKIIKRLYCIQYNCIVIVYIATKTFIYNLSTKTNYIYMFTVYNTVSDFLATGPEELICLSYMFCLKMYF